MSGFLDLLPSLSTGWPDRFKNGWDVFLLFLIPIGGGIPAGVVLAESKGFRWFEMEVLYLVSDVILACVFEPVMLALVRLAKNSQRLAKAGEAVRLTIARTTAHFGTHLGPLALVLVSFGSDPMTGRMVTYGAGYPFIHGWAIAICGDLLYFSLIMASTLWLSDLLGNGQRAEWIVLGGMIFIPILIRRVKQLRLKKKDALG